LFALRTAAGPDFHIRAAGEEIHKRNREAAGRPIRPVILFACDCRTPWRRDDQCPNGIRPARCELTGPKRLCEILDGVDDPLPASMGHKLVAGKTPQHITTIGLDLANHWFQIHGVNAAGKVVVRRRLRRTEAGAFFPRPRTLPGWHGILRHGASSGEGTDRAGA
jgi:hypothetical protein